MGDPGFVYRVDDWTLNLAAPMISDEDFTGFSTVSTSTPSQQGYISINSGGYVDAANDKSIPAGTQAFGLMRGSLASVPGGGIGGMTRQNLFSLPMGSIPPGYKWAFRVRASPGVCLIPSLAEDYEVFAGVTDGAPTALTDGIYFRFNKDAAVWVFVHERLGAKTILPTNIGFSTVDFHILAFEITADGLSIDVYEDGALVGTVTPLTLQVNDDLASTALGMANLGGQANLNEYEIDRVRWERPNYV